MLKFLFLTFLLLNTLYANTLYQDFIDEQLQEGYILQDVNISDKNQNAVLDKRYKQFGVFLNALLQDRKENLNTIPLQDKTIFRLQQKIKLNNQRGNHYSVLRDRAQLATLKVEDALAHMLILLISSSYEKSQQSYVETLNEALKQNQHFLKKLDLSFEDKIEKADQSHDIIKKALKNIDDLNTLIALNHDLREYISTYKDSIYKSSLYANFGLNKLNKIIEDSNISKRINPSLDLINLDTSKLFLILLILFFTFTSSTLLYALINFALNRWPYKVDELQFILNRVRSIIRTIIFLFGLELILDIFLGIGQDADTSSKFFSMSYVALITYLVYKIANTIAIIKIQSIQQRTKDYRNEVINLGIKALNFVIFSIGFLIILKVFGVNLTAILSGLGIGSLAVAFAAKDTLSNFFGSISILLDNPFSQGDWIEVDGKSGTVIEIGIRSTTIRTFENAMVTIPNLTLANSSVENWSNRTLGRRIKMHVGVTYESDFKDLENAISEIKEMLLKHPKIASDKTEYSNTKAQLRLVSKEDHSGVKRLLSVNLDTFSASSIDILVYCFTKSTDWKEWLDAKEDVMYKIASILKSNNLSFAYPALAIHMQDKQEDKED